MAFSVKGSTTGEFYLGPIPVGTSLEGLTFAGTDFGPTTNPTLTLGTFDLNTLLGYYDPFDFKLTVNFTVPAVGGSVFSADLSGLVSIFGGSATVNFLGGPKHFTFYDGGSGSFDLSISDLSIRNGKTATLIGTISNATFAPNPEPAAILLSTSLLGGLAILFRKRLRG
jgi:hypothetical protein